MARRPYSCDQAASLKTDFTLSDFHFDLPAELIAQYPTSERSGSRLLIVDDALQDRKFTDIADLLNPGDLLIFNNSKVIPARLFGTKPTGGKVEMLVERLLDSNRALALLRSSKKTAPATQILIDADSGTSVTLIDRDVQAADRFVLQFQQPMLDVLHAFGKIPLPPYIAHKPNSQDKERYQTVYAQIPGSVAAPTAGLHFDLPLLQALASKGVHRAEVTLHVGSGTFAPVRSENIDEHQMHSEWCEIPPATAQAVAEARSRGGRVIAVGTTSLRTLESAVIDRAGAKQKGLVRTGSWETDIFIRPGYQFQVVDGLLTNFHLPKSTLLMLIAAFIGYEKMRAAYQHAIDQRYRFFSYGDAMFCPKHL